jgi:MFS family permease
MIATLRQRDFLLAWVGGLVSMIGNWVLLIVLPIYVYQLTGSALATSGMFVAEIVPALALGSVAGVFVDRWDRKRTMVIANLALAVTLLPLLAVRSADLIWLAYVVAFVQSTITQFFHPAENALLPRLVGEERLLTANALNALNNNLARLIGPAVGGLAMAAFGITGVVLIDAASFLLSMAMIALIATSGAVDRSATDASETAHRAWRRVWREWADGVALLRRNRAVAALLSLIGVSALGEGVMGVMFVVWVNDVLDGSSRELGWLMSAQAVGGLLGGALLGSFVQRHAPVRVFGIGSIVFGLLDLALFNYPNFISGVWLGLVIIGLVGIPTIGISAAFMTMLQQAVRDAYRGRVFGLMGTIYALMQLAGTLIAGALGGLLGPIVLLTIQGGSYVAMGLLALAILPRLLASSKPESGLAHAEEPTPGVGAS